jgi:D-alanyl-D-alanine carboxypeptidase
MAKLYNHLIKTYPEFMKYMEMPRIYNPGTKLMENNTNPLMENSENRRAHPVIGVIGGKTGTSRRGLNLGAMVDTIINVLGQQFPVQAVILTFGNTTPKGRIEVGQNLIQRGLDNLTLRIQQRRELAQSSSPTLEQF